MLIQAGHDVPLRVGIQFKRDEMSVATLRGVRDSGFALSGQRLFAWRANGAVGPLPLSAIDRILIDTGGGDHLEIVVLPRRALHPPVVLTRRVNELGTTLGFVARIATALGCEPTLESLGPVHRFTFPQPPQAIA